VASSTTKDLPALTLVAAATTSLFVTFNISRYSHHTSSRCVPMMIRSAPRRSTLARFVDPKPSITFHPSKLRVVHQSSHVLTISIQGKLYVRGDSKIFRFQNGKTESLFLQRKNPRRIAWTTLYRRMHKKGISEVRKDGLLIIKLIRLAESSP
jgi:ribosomal protein L24E